MLPIAEALIYASAGFIFGREVHREEAAKSDKRANKESNRATDAIANGRALKSSIKGFASQYEPQRMDNLYQLFSIEGSAKQAPLIKTDMKTDLNKLILEADKYFPG